MGSNMIAKFLCLLSVVVLANATAYGWGRNDYAQLGLGHTNPVFVPTAIPYYASTSIFDILTATNYHIALATNGSAYGGGLQYFGQFGNGYASGSAFTRPIPCPNLNTSLDISLPGTSCNAHMNTNLLGWGNVAGYVQAKTTGTFPRIQTALPAYRFDGKVLAVNSVMEGVLVRLANNTVWAAGTNGNGRLGIGNAVTTYNFVEVTFWRNVPLRQIFSSQSQHVCALAVNGSLYCWGQNTFGQLGVGDTSPRFSPTRVTFFEQGGYEIYKVVYGDTFTVVLTCSGRIFAFGANTFGQLGTGVPDANSHSTPEEVKINNGNIGNETVVEVISGASQTMVRTSANNWFVWGGGTSGSLGLGVGRDQYTPTLNPSLKNNGINRIKSSSQSFNFFGWQDPSVTDQRIGCALPVNECMTGAANCSANAYCTDLERGYKCTCAGGWVGDGYASGSGCVNEYSCDIIGNLCVPNTTCDDSSGVAVCKCPDGFIGDGRLDGTGCIDVDECQGNACALNAYCTNTAGSYFCTCNPGYIGDPDIAGCTILCQPGQYATNFTNCDLCPPGTYTDITDAKNCFPCPAGTYNTQWGNDAVTDCVKCPVGGYSAPKSTYCSLCIHGYTNDPSLIHVDDSTCTACPLGTYGYYGQCYPCNQGRYSNDALAKRCRNCPPGFANNITSDSSTLCSPCPAGTHTRGGMGNCTTCPAGYYSPPGSKDCLKCRPGTSTNGLTGQSSCSSCLAGYFNSKFASPTCSACPAGTFSYGTGSTRCKRCSPGTYSSSPASTACTACGNGTYASGSGSSRCSNCDSGYASIDGVTCAPCKPGNFFDSDTRACKPCAPGSFVAVSGANSCFACSPGSYASDSGSPYCKRCGVNTYSSASTGFVTCTDCPLGSSSSGGAYTCS